MLCALVFSAFISPASPYMSCLHYVSYCGPESVGNIKQTLILQDSVLLQIGRTKIQLSKHYIPLAGPVSIEVESVIPQEAGLL